MKIDIDHDAYGKEILAYFQGEDTAEIVERDDGHIGLSMGPDCYFYNYPKWKSHEKKAIRYAKGRVLDIGCGPGRVSLHLQKKGFDPIAIDNSPLAIRVARKRGVKNAKIMSITGITAFKDSQFDSIVMFGNNFGLFGSPSKAKRLLRTMHRITSDDATIIAESNNPYGTDDKIHKAYLNFNRNRGRMPGQLRLRVRYRNVKGKWFDYLIVSKAEMRKIVSGTGWKITEFIDSEKTPYFAILKKTV